MKVRKENIVYLFLLSFLIAELILPTSMQETYEIKTNSSKKDVNISQTVMEETKTNNILKCYISGQENCDEKGELDKNVSL